ncbi:hypothetical protein PIB30_103626, partial [Stylosanthes scabra]|nr:hypothetical protein [Stylosanthes scabra]
TLESYHNSPEFTNTTPTPSLNSLRMLQSTLNWCYPPPPCPYNHQFKHQDHSLKLELPITRRKELSKEFSSSYLHNWYGYDENDESNE